MGWFRKQWHKLNHAWRLLFDWDSYEQELDINSRSIDFFQAEVKRITGELETAYYDLEADYEVEDFTMVQALQEELCVAESRLIAELERGES